MRFDKETRLERKKTKKEAIHKVGRQFRSQNIWVAFPTPSIYRHQHAGKQK